MKRTVIYVSIFMVLAICSSVFGAEMEHKSNKDLFFEKYNKWKVFANDQTIIKAFSVSDNAAGQYWEDIINLGPEALPYIDEEMRNDSVLSKAFAQITRIKPNKDRLLIPQKININEMWTPYRDFYLTWWNDDRKKLDANIKKDLIEYRKLKAMKKPQKQIDDAIKHIRESYGIFALPYVIPEIEKGDNELAATAWDMLDSIEGDKEKNEKFRLEFKEKVKGIKERKKIILDVASRNGDRLKAIRDLIPMDVTKDKNNNGK